MTGERGRMRKGKTGKQEKGKAVKRASGLEDAYGVGMGAVIRAARWESWWPGRA